MSLILDMGFSHGMSRKEHTQREYRIWGGLKNRCLNPNAQDYKNYGGRGIKVCDRWATSFDNFFYDMGISPEGSSIDRIDNDGDYEPGNCRWADRKTQNNNTRSVPLYEVDGEKLSIAQIAAKNNLNKGTLWSRVVQYGMSLEDAIKFKNHARRWRRKPTLTTP
jgi:hypothetical protein